MNNIQINLNSRTATHKQYPNQPKQVHNKKTPQGKLNAFTITITPFYLLRKHPVFIPQHSQ